MCRKNDGHLIRIVGPAFETVSSWARQGIPINVVIAGIDRYFERYYRKGPRRRPVPVMFCEGDVLAAFDDWRRAVGVAGLMSPATGSGAERRRDSLAAHVEQVLTRLTAARAGMASDALATVVDRVTQALDLLQPTVRRARGEARDVAIATLAELDRELMMVARAVVSEEVRAVAARDAAVSLMPFKARMPPDAYERALAAAVDREVRAALRLPALEF